MRVRDAHGKRRRTVEELPPTPSQRRALAAFLLTGKYPRAAELLFLSKDTVKSHVYEALARLGVSSPGEAAVALGWLDIPDEDKA